MENGVILEGERKFNSEEVRLAFKELLRFRALLLYIVMSIVLLAIGGTFIGLSFVFQYDITILLSGIFITAMIVPVWIMYLLTALKIKKRDYKDTIYKYRFCENEVIISVHSLNFNQHMALKYSDVFKCAKCKTYTYLFFNKYQAYFFLNDDLTEEVYNVLKSKVRRYKGF